MSTANTHLESRRAAVISEPSAGTYFVEDARCATREDALWLADLREVVVELTAAQARAVTYCVGIEGRDGDEDVDRHAYPTLHRQTARTSRLAGNLITRATVRRAGRTVR